MDRAICTNTTPLEGFTATNLKSVCPSCGAFLKVLASGSFRTHKIVEVLSADKVAERVERMKAGLIMRGNGHTGPDPR